MFFIITLVLSSIHVPITFQHHCDSPVAHTKWEGGSAELQQDSPKFLLKKSMINVFSHLPQQVAHWKVLSRGFGHEKNKNHRAGQIHECLLAPGKPSRLETCQRAFFGFLPVFCSGETLCGGTSSALVKAN